MSNEHGGGNDGSEDRTTTDLSDALEPHRVSSSRTVKTDLSPVDVERVLSGVEDLSIARWRYEEDPAVVHMGPIAEEFHETFGLGADDNYISTVDADGVAFAAIQGLAERLEETRRELDRTRALAREREDRIDAQKRLIERQQSRIDDLETRVDDRDERIATLERRVEAIADVVGTEDGTDLDSVE